MKKFREFYFKCFDFDIADLKASFHYSFDNEVFFVETLDFKNENFQTINTDEKVLNGILFHLHIALGISYYKAFPTKDLIVESGHLDEYQISFWKKFYTNGLGEFLYTNQISPKGLFNFVNINYNITSHDKGRYPQDGGVIKDHKSLVPIGGGKDSIVTIELLKNAGKDYDLFVFGKIDELKQATSDISGKKILHVKRNLSEKLFELNKQGYYNGHVPITGIIAFSMEVVAYLYGYKYLILSNEKSANYGNTMWEGVDINHQYSKSLDFEKDFGEYVEKYISKGKKYFSLLRGMYEIKIAELFVKYGKKYFKKFSSCNNNFKIINSSHDKIGRRHEVSTPVVCLKGGWDRKTYWCNNCPKCAFVFSILRPYLSNKEVLEIFGEDLYEKKDLEKLFRELLGITGIKPFECVGEAEEVVYAMNKTIENHYKDSKKLPFILEMFNNEVSIKFDKQNLKNIEKKLVTIYNEDIIPTEIKKVLKNTK